MKIVTLLGLKSKFGHLLSEKDILDALSNGQLVTHAFYRNEDLRVPFEAIREARSKIPGFESRFIVFLNAPEALLDPRSGIGPVLKLGDRSIPLIQTYFYEDEVYDIYLSEKFPIFKHIRPKSDDCGMIEIRDSSGAWTIETLRKDRAYIFKRLFDLYFTGADRTLNIDDLVEETDINRTEIKFKKMFEGKKKNLPRYCESVGGKNVRLGNFDITFPIIAPKPHSKS